MSVAINSNIRRILVGIVFACLATVMKGQGPAVAGTPITPILVELFTSEGCSSCPPADTFLQQLDDFQPVPGARLIVLSEHVDYWDHDGWKDPYSSAAFTERQQEYVRELGLQTAFTPQFVVDGTKQFGMDNSKQANDTLLKAGSETMVPVRIESAAIESGSPSVLRAHIDVDGTSEKHNADVFVAVALNQAESDVLRGENRGRRLTYVAVVQELKRIGKLEKGKHFSQDLNLKLNPGIALTNCRIIAFVQESGPGRVVGAALQKIAN